MTSVRPRQGQGRGYAVGYGKPPSTSRFKPGQSGNAKGRPKGRKNLKTLIRQAMTAMITVQEGSSGRHVTKLEGVVLRQLQNALKGNDRSAMAVIAIGEGPGPLGALLMPVFQLETPAQASRHLYETLHHCDALGLRSILVVMPPDRPEWQAVRDRLLRATRPLASE